MDVHVRDLRYFLAVARELSFTRAAETLYISQPALSKQIRALERQLRVSLFAREPTGARLSRAGRELVPFAERIVADGETAKAALARASDSTLVLGMHTSPGRRLLPEVRARLVAACPDATLELRQVAWADRTAGLAERATDAAFAWLPLPQPPYRWVTIAREPRLPRGRRRAPPPPLPPGSRARAPPPAGSRPPASRGSSRCPRAPRSPHARASCWPPCPTSRSSLSPPPPARCATTGSRSRSAV